MTKKKYKDSINVQLLYDEGKLSSDDFYHGATNLIKSLLMRYLIYKGHYKNGVRQTNYDQEDVDDCFTYIYGKIIDKYDPSIGTIGTFIRRWVQGYGTIITQKQRRKYKYLNNILPIDLNLQNSINEEYKDPFTFEDLCNKIDNDHFGSGYTFSFTLEEIDEVRKKVICTL